MDILPHLGWSNNPSLNTDKNSELVPHTDDFQYGTEFYVLGTKT